MVTAADVAAAAKALSGALVHTPCAVSRTLSQVTGATVAVKFENLQFTGAFKERGALNKLLSLGEDETQAGVVAMSAGNHAQAVAYHAQRLGIPATIVMPLFTPNVKIQHTKKLGARVVLHGESLSEADTHSHLLAEQKGLTFVHPYDDEKVIAGQGTVALEMLDAIPDLEVLVVPIGGGGLISGMALAAKARNPDIEVIGVQTALYPSMIQALGGQTIACGGQTIAEGIAVKRPGATTQAIIRDLVDDMVTVEENDIERAMVLYLEIEKTVAEGAGAAALAALLAQPERFAGRKTGLVLSGGNVDSRLLASVIMRGLVRDGRLIRLHISIPDAPGQLARITQLVGEHEGNIVEVSHHRMMLGLPAKNAELDLLVEIREPAHGDKLVAALEAGGYGVRRASPS